MFEALFRPFRKSDPLLDLWNEVDANLECFFVLDQRQFISSGFKLQAWEAIRHSTGLHFNTEVLEYAVFLDSFNQAFVDMKQFEQMYGSSMENKTRANAEILHGKVEALDEMAMNLRPIIMRAREQIRLMRGAC